MLEQKDVSGKSEIPSMPIILFLDLNTPTGRGGVGIDLGVPDETKIDMEQRRTHFPETWINDLEDMEYV
jgi:hypothetical protein